jgi:hypothetical protein
MRYITDGRVRLSRVSSNLSGRRANAERVIKPTPSQLAAMMNLVTAGSFIHTEIPIGDSDDLQDVVEFKHIIYRSMRSKEQLSASFRFSQPELTLRDRNLDIDAFDRFHSKLGLTTNALYRLVGIFDRYLSAVPVTKSKLRVVGCPALLIASKIEDIYPADSRNLIQLCDPMLTRQRSNWSMRSSSTRHSRRPSSTSRSS